MRLIKSYLKMSLPLGAALIVGCVGSDYISRTLIERPTSQPLLLKSEKADYLDHQRIITVGIVDTCLLTIDNFEQPAVTLYSLKTKKKLASFGYRGPADTCLNYALYDNQYFNKGGDVIFYMSDAGKNTFLTFSLRNILKSGSSKPIEKMILPSELAPDFLSIFKTKQNFLVGNHFTARGKGRLFIYDITKGSLRWEKYLPETKQLVPQNQQVSYYYSYAAFNNDQQILATSLKLFPRVDFYDFENERKYFSTFKGFENFEPPLMPASREPDQTTYYTSCFGGKRNLYAMSVDDKASVYFSGKGNMKLDVFNWDGTLKTSVKLDKIHLGKFAVDEVNKVLYVVEFGSAARMAPRIITYDLSNSKI